MYDIKRQLEGFRSKQIVRPKEVFQNTPVILTIYNDVVYIWNDVLYMKDFFVKNKV